LEFIYSDSLQDASAYNSVDLLLLADRYNVEKLRIDCEKALAKTIDVSNAANLLSVASRITAPYLLKKVAKFIRSSSNRDLVRCQFLQHFTLAFFKQMYFEQFFSKLQFGFVIFGAIILAQKLL
jgi:hypothetical protein